MSIEIRAKVDRENSIFMAGESFAVSIFLRNLSDTQASSLAWGCVQLHCDQALLRAAQPTDRADDDGGASKTSPSSAPLTAGGNRTTSMPSRAKRAIFSSKPAIIFCDVHLKAREILQFEHSLEIPLHFPPTFKGRFVRYHWYVSVAVQHVDAPIKVLQLAIRVVNMTVDVLTSISACEKEKERIFTENPFLSRDKKPPSIVELAVGRVEELTSVRSIQTYEIKSSHGVFANIEMFKNFYKLGDDVIGRISFPSPLDFSSITCLQVLIRMETVEINLSGGKREEHITPIFTEHFITAFMKETHFKIPIPLTATAAFSTEAIQLRWRLHFEFVTTTQTLINAPLSKSDTSTLSSEEHFAALAADLNIETMAWDHYICVHSCNPYNVALVSVVTPSSVSLVV